jgi:hypothetical protein
MVGEHGNALPTDSLWDIGEEHLDPGAYHGRGVRRLCRKRSRRSGKRPEQQHGRSKDSHRFYVAKMEDE